MVLQALRIHDSALALSDRRLRLLVIREPVDVSVRFAVGGSKMRGGRPRRNNIFMDVFKLWIIG